MSEMTGEQRCLIHSANRSLEWWDAVGGNVLGRCVEAGAMGTPPPGPRWQGFRYMDAVGEKSACRMTLRGRGGDGQQGVQRRKHTSPTPAKV